MKEKMNVKTMHERAHRAGWQIGRLFGVGMPLILIGIAALDYVQALMSPEVMGAAHGTAREGSVQAVAIRLSNPSLLDRLVASLPSLTILLTAALTLGYLAWSANQRAHHVPGFRATKVRKNFFGAAGFVVVFSSVAMNQIGRSYFEAELVFRGGMVALVVGAAALVVLDSVDAKGYWNQEHGRATELDKKMQDVV